MQRLKMLLMVVLLTASPLVLTGCASSIAETPAQRVYAAQSEYAGLLAAVAYESQRRCVPPETSLTAACSQQDIVDEIRLYDNDAHAALMAAQELVRDPTATSSAITASLSVARQALNVFQGILVRHKLIGAPTVSSMPPLPPNALATAPKQPTQPRRTGVPL